MVSSAATTFLALISDGLQTHSFVKLALTRPVAADAAPKLMLRRVVLRGVDHLSFVHRHATKDITKNLPVDEALRRLSDLLGAGYRSAHLQRSDTVAELVFSVRGQCTLRRSKPTSAVTSEATAAEPTETHDRPRQRLIDARQPYLHALGITDAEQRVVPAMARKWRQINKFVELFAGALERSGLHTAATGIGNSEPLRIVDFGSGKGYLTFALHDHLTSLMQRPTSVTGIELRPELADDSEALARRLGLAGLQFAQGDVRDFAPTPVDAVIALHACDTATDHALHFGLRAGAGIIMCSPCCQKELRPQLMAPHPLRPLLAHGVHLGQQADMLTDGLRALLLEACGYDTQVFEFVALEHSQKNKMILAVRRGTAAPASEALQQIHDIKSFYGVRDQCLERLLRADGMLPPASL